jgi:hypothetical protein
MAYGAIFRRIFLPMTVETSAHIVAHQLYRYCCLRHIAMASCAAHTRLIMLGMFELYMGCRGKCIHPLPRDFYLFICVGNDFFHFRFVVAELGVTQHALVDRGDARVCMCIRASVAIDTIEPHFEVRVMWKCDRLLCAHGQRSRHQNAQHHPPQSMRLPVDHRIGLTYHVT